MIILFWMNVFIRQEKSDRNKMKKQKKETKLIK